ncbi:MAG: phosphoribosylamine--glycine ligase, partial [Acidovorax sp.]
MRFLGVGDTNDLAAMYWGLARRGHDVRVFVRDPAYRDVFAGMLTTTD